MTDTASFTHRGYLVTFHHERWHVSYYPLGFGDLRTWTQTYTKEKFARRAINKKLDKQTPAP